MALHTNDVIALEILCNTLKERFTGTDRERDATEIINAFHALVMEAEVNDSLIEDMALSVKVAREVTNKVSEIANLEIKNWAVYDEASGTWKAK